MKLAVGLHQLESVHTCLQVRVDVGVLPIQVHAAVCRQSRLCRFLHPSEVHSPPPGCDAVAVRHRRDSKYFGLVLVRFVPEMARPKGREELLKPAEGLRQYDRRVQVQAAVSAKQRDAEEVGLVRCCAIPCLGWVVLALVEPGRNGK